MSLSPFRRALASGLAAIGLPVEESAQARLEVHYELLCKWAPKVNLTTVTAPEAAASLHYVDSLSLRWVDASEDPVIDVGSGAGFPGIVLAAVTGRPTVLLEPLRKRTSFLRVAVREMGLDQVRVVQGRVEPRDRTGLFPTSDVVVSRATFPPVEWFERAPAVLAPGGRLILSTGRDGASPTELADRAQTAGLCLRTQRKLSLPGGHQRTLTVWSLASSSD